MFKRFFKEYESEKTEGRKSKYFKFTRRVQEVQRRNVASGTMPTVPIEPTCCPPLNIEKKLWQVISPRVRHVILGNLGELWVTEEYPNEKYGPSKLWNVDFTMSYMRGVLQSRLKQHVCVYVAI